MDIEVYLDAAVQLSSDAIYAIQVPFALKGASGVGLYDFQCIDTLGIISNDNPKKRQYWE
jgi:hypothetical protein